MSFSVEFAFRIIGAVAGAIGAGKLGQGLARLVNTSPESYVVILGLVGFLAGLVLTPYVTTRPMARMRRGLADTPPGRLAAIIVGIFLGLVAAALFSLPLSLLPSPFRQIMPLAAALLFCYLSVVIMTSRQDDLQALFNSFRASSLPVVWPGLPAPMAPATAPMIRNANSTLKLISS